MLDLETVTRSGSGRLVGRDCDLATIRSILRPADAPAVLLVGEAGIGKTSLLRAVAEDCEAAGMARLHAVGLPGNVALPLAAIADFLPDSLPSGPGGGFAALREHLTAQAALRPTLICIDDVDHIDQASTELLALLASVPRTRILLTTRAETAPAALTERITRRRGLRVQPVAALTRSMTADLAASVLGGPLDGMSADQLWRLSNGNPLFVRHLVELGLQSGVLDDSTGIWTWRDPPTAPAALRDLVSDVIGVLEPAERCALGYVAHGEVVSVSLLSRLVDRSTIDSLQLRLLITVDSRGTVRLGHPLYGEVARAASGALRSRRLLRDLADAAGQENDSEQMLRVTTWRLRSGLQVTRDDLERAGIEALDRSDPVLAEHLARAAAPDEPLTVLCQALVAQNKVEEVEAALLRAEQAGASVDPGLGDWRAALRVLNLFWGLRRPEDARALLAAREHPDGSNSPELRIARLALAVFGPDPELDTDLLTGVSPPCPVLTGVEGTLHAYALTFAGYPQQVADGFQRGQVRMPGLWPTMHGAMAACHLHALMLSGDLKSALVLGEDYYLAAIERGDRSDVATVCLELGVTAAWAGDRQQAMTRLGEARALADDRLPFPIQAYIFAEFAAAAAAIGDFAKAEAGLAEAVLRLPAGAGLQDHLAMAKVRKLACSGKVATAAALIPPLVERYLATGRRTNAVECLYYLARLKPSAATADQLAAAIQGGDGELFPLLAAHASGLARQNAEVLASVMAEFEARGFIGMAREAAVVVTKLRTGSRYQAAAQRLLDSTTGAPPLWAVLPPAVDLLTWREREVCELAASGLENTVVAERLAVSVRTVDNHLHRAYEKLRIRGRLELAGALGLRLPHS
ncbi:AAA family ATPase [Kribbella sp. NPDC056861]|uniref:helix-turn-helix transcriptional regulator n=1 Tax=Kribbella sp. NPDC056861 TaxID=3154857 RepID=UPI003425AF71